MKRVNNKNLRTHRGHVRSVSIVMKKGPDYIQLYPTLRCNLGCEFCFNRGLPAATDMSFEDFKTMVKRLKQIGVRALDIMGGEPTMHQDILRFLHLAQDEGMFVNMSSNGTNTHILAKMMTDLNSINIGVSVNDLKTALDLKDFLTTYKPVIKTVASHQLDEGLIPMLLSFGPRKFYLLFRDTLKPEQLGRSMPFDRFRLMVQHCFSSRPIDTVFCSGFLPDIESYPGLSLVRCPAGTTKLGILPDGSVYPCNLFFGNEKMLLGNILTDPFERIWHHPALSFFRTFRGNSCPRKTCELHAVCHGGCPAHSLAHFGDLSAPDPRCLLE